MAIETIDVADALACAVDDSYDEEQNVFLSAGAVIAETGRVVLTVVVTEASTSQIVADTPDEETTYRTFRFLGKEV